MPVSHLGSNPTSLGPYNKTFLYEERLIHLFISTLVFADRCGDGIGSDRSSFESWL